MSSSSKSPPRASSANRGAESQKSLANATKHFDCFLSTELDPTKRQELVKGAMSFDKIDPKDFSYDLMDLFAGYLSNAPHLRGRKPKEMVGTAWHFCRQIDTIVL